MSNQIRRVEDSFCPVCGFNCAGKGGVGCIDKPGLVEGERKIREAWDMQQCGNGFKGEPCKHEFLNMEGNSGQPGVHSGHDLVPIPIQKEGSK